MCSACFRSEVASKARQQLLLLLRSVAPRQRNNGVTMACPTVGRHEVVCIPGIEVVKKYNIYIYHNIWDNPSHWLIFFNMVKTTNQIHIYIYDIHYIFKLCNYRYTLCTVYIKKLGHKDGLDAKNIATCSLLYPFTCVRNMSCNIYWFEHGFPLISTSTIG